ncbi:MAG: integration host factor subunit beta [Gammaproteobacteria bacterium]|nr:integration host factor subunit beta [Gammaproteobacteria bacterium]
MKKTDLILSLSNHSDLSKADAKASVEVILEALTQGIVSGDGVEVRGFGGFYKKHRKARLGINPKTSERTQVGEKFVPFFKPGKSLREAVDNQ